jgi:hypothetical protein
LINSLQRLLHTSCFLLRHDPHAKIVLIQQDN